MLYFSARMLLLNMLTLDDDDGYDDGDGALVRSPAPPAKKPSSVLFFCRCCVLARQSKHAHVSLT